MRRIILLLSISAMLFSNALAQPIAQLDPQTFFKEDAVLTPTDWMGFYKTFPDKYFMVIVPAGDSIVGYYTNIYQNGILVGIFKGGLKGNGVHFKWTETFMRGKKGNTMESGFGFMVMKENRNDVYCRHGEIIGHGCYTAGRKDFMEEYIERPAHPVTYTGWTGLWKLNFKWSNPILDLNEYVDGYVGYYTLKGYTTSSQSGTFNTGININTTHMPDRTVMILGIPYDQKLYFLQNNWTESTVSFGVMTIGEDNNSFSGIMYYKEAGIKYDEEMSGSR